MVQWLMKSHLPIPIVYILTSYRLAVPIFWFWIGGGAGVNKALKLTLKKGICENVFICVEFITFGAP